MNKLFSIFRRGVLLPLILFGTIGMNTPAQAYTTSYRDLLKRIYSFFALFFTRKNTSKSTRPAVAAAQARVFNMALSSPELALGPSQNSHNDAALNTLVDKLHAFVTNATACKKNFLNGNIKRSYRDFNTEFKNQITSLKTEVLNPLNAHGATCCACAKLYSIAQLLNQAQDALCSVLNDDYSVSISLGWALAKIKQPTVKFRDQVNCQIADLQKMVRGKSALVKKLKALQRDVHLLLTPPDEQGMSEFALLGVMQKRV